MAKFRRGQRQILFWLTSMPLKICSSIFQQTKTSKSREEKVNQVWIKCSEKKKGVTWPWRREKKDLCCTQVIMHTKKAFINKGRDFEVQNQLRHLFIAFNYMQTDQPIPSLYDATYLVIIDWLIYVYVSASFLYFLWII